jgi:hypothetical protein
MTKEVERIRAAIMDAVLNRIDLMMEKSYCGVA